MAVTIKSKPGQATQLTNGSDPLPIRIEIGWDAAKGGAKVDMDISVVLRDQTGEAQDVCYYENLNPYPWITHSEDDTDGTSSAGGADEFIDWNVHETDPQFIVGDIFANIYDAAARGQTWASLDNAFINVIDKKNNNQIRIEPSFDLMAAAETTMFVARVVRQADGKSWKLIEVNNKFLSNFRDLQSFADALMSPTQSY